MSTPQIRLARPDEVELVQELEELAGERYSEAGLPSDLEGLAVEVVARAQEERLLWVISEAERPVGFALCWLRPAALHLRELDVHPARMGCGLGRALVEHVVVQAMQQSLEHVTLTTFRDVPWNAPLYRRWGFVELSALEQPRWLRSIREEEDAGELASWPRLAMARALR